MLPSLQQLGRSDISVDDVKNWSKQIAQGKTQSPWSDATITRCAREVLSTLRDFGILESAYSPVYLRQILTQHF